MVEWGLGNQRVLNSNTTSTISRLYNLRHISQFHCTKILDCKMGIIILIIPCCEGLNEITDYWYIVGSQPVLPLSSSLRSLPFLLPGCPSTQNVKSKMLTSGRRSRENKELFNSSLLWFFLATWKPINWHTS